MFDFNEIFVADSITSATQLLASYPEAKIIAGGTDLLVKAREGHLKNTDLVSIRSIRELEGIQLDDEENIHIKPLTTFKTISNNLVIKKRIPLLAEAVKTIGGPQVRAVATIGGNISNGFTTADSPPSLFTLNAVIEITGKESKRQVPIEKYYLAPEKVDLNTGELVTDIIIKKENYQGYSGYYMKYAIRDSLDISLIGCAVSVKTSKTGLIQDIRLSFGAAAGIPIRGYHAEHAVKGKMICDDTYKVFGKKALEDVSVISDKRASKEFRLHLCEILPQRTLEQAIIQTGNKR